MKPSPKIDTNISIDALNERSRDTMAEWLGIEYIEVQESYLKARMPVDKRTWQPLKMLNGGASLALAETVGSMAANLIIDRSKYVAFGMEINANHIKPVREGHVYAYARPVHSGKTSQVWDIRIHDEEGDTVCISRLTMAVVEIKDDLLRLK
jgi:1,4-dihydroxy-2-naphthoyl-CoA hydrolase